MRAPLAALLALVSGCAAPTGLAGLRRDARAMRPLVSSPLARSFVDAVQSLPPIAPRVVRWTNAAGEPKERRVDEEYYYTTRYGTPLAYARAYDLLAAHGLDGVSGRRIVDFGYGNVGQLLMLASLGADAAGVDVDPLLPAMYAERNGPFAGGKVRTLSGKLTGLRAELGDGYTLFIAKNTLKRGYVHPSQPVTDKERIDLGADDETFVRTVFDLLAPGGFFLIYNLAPAPAPPGKKYIPWADGRSPFPRALYEQVGFRVIAFEVDDTAFARTMGHALGWDRGPEAMDLSRDLFGQWTLVQKP
jgi:hypothetical protein